MSHARSILFKIITRTALVAGLSVGIVFIPNLTIFDEKLSPEITQLLSKPADPDITGNAAIQVYGLRADSHLDILQVGKSLLAQLRQKHKKGEPANLSDQEEKVLFGNNDFDKEWEALYPAIGCNYRNQDNCLPMLRAQIRATPVNDQRLQIQLERYSAIIQQPHFIEDTRGMDFSSPLPDYSTLLHLNRLRNVSILEQRGLNGLIDNKADIRFWRMALTESQTLLGKMVALVTLRADLASLSQAVREEPQLTNEHISALKKLLEPLNQDEINIDEAFTSELRIVVDNQQEFFKSFSNQKVSNLWFLNLLVQPTASVNLYFKQTYKPVYAFGKLSSPDFYSRAQQPVKQTEFSNLNPYNLGGKIKLSKPWQLADYIGRVHDVAGIYSLIALQVELKTHLPQDVVAAIKASPHKNPYTDKPFEYDSANKILSFTCFDAKDVCKIAI